MPNAIVFYRIARWLYLKRIPVLPSLFQLLIFLLYNSKVPPTADIGKGTYLICKGIATVVIDGARIGTGCRIGIGVRIIGKGPYKNVPQIGNHVFMGAGSVIAGPVIIGDNAVIAPNAVVTKSVPAGAIVGGIPARIIGRVDQLNYDILANQADVDGHADYLA
ncbi:serine O-acetyltransferase [Janthinobacterium sp. LB3P112]|jgi:serine O-acetyltransferase|uniref:serine O-acetyltransferase n=1 Tax=Janthinobacterium sp. LB3P112 TaxID=3424196 RepID=UPI003F1F558D